MQRYLEQELARDVRRKGPRAALVDALYAPAACAWTTTRSAPQCRRSLRGAQRQLPVAGDHECRAGAPARPAGAVPQRHSDAGWGRSGDLLVSSGHVNLVLRHPSGDARTRFDVVEAMLIDFEPPRPGEKQYSRSISESTVLAMYMNNRAAESLAAGEVDRPTGSRAAIESEPTFLAAHNTLAVVYLRHGQPQRAERVLQRLLAAEPANTAALANLARLYEKQGARPRLPPCSSASRASSRCRPTTTSSSASRPCSGATTRRARRCSSEVDRAAYHHEFHFGLALAELRPGQREGSAAPARPGDEGQHARCRAPALRRQARTPQGAAHPVSPRRPA